MDMSALESDAKATPAWRLWLACVTVALMPLSFNLGYYLAHWLPQAGFQLLPKGLQEHLLDEKPLYFSPQDPLLALWLLILAWDLFKGRLKDWLPPAPNLVWAGVAVLSFLWLPEGGRGAWFKAAFLQTALLIVCGVWIFRHIGTETRTYRKLALVLGASLGLCLLYALYQYVGPVGRPLKPGEKDLALAGGVTNVRVAGWYGYRGQLAAQVALLVPAAAAYAALGRSAEVRVAAGALAVLGLCVCLSAGGVIAASAGVLAVAAALYAARDRLHGGPLVTTPAWKGALLVGALVLVWGVVLPRLPRDHVASLWDSLTFYRKVETPKGLREESTARLRRHQAALKLLSKDERWKTGVGAGQFQGSVNVFYDVAYPKPGANTDDEAAFDQEADEPFTFGLYETTAVELGLGGLLAALWVYLAWGASAFSALLRLDDPDARALALASLGAAVGAAVFSIFGHPLVRGCGGTLCFFMGLAFFLNARAAERKSA